MDGMEVGKEIQKEGDCWSSVMKNTSAWQACGSTTKGKIFSGMSGCETERNCQKWIVRKERIIKRRIWKLNENRTIVKFERVLVITNLPDL